MRRAPDDRTLLDFGSEFLVVCPRCAGQAWVRDRGSEPERGQAPIALTCPHCGLSQFWQPAQAGTQHRVTAADPKRYSSGVVTVGGPVDWYFHLPLWLQAPCCGETLWAYNAAHLDFLESFVRATLREHARGARGWSNQALANRLPAWMKDAHNRDAMLKCIGQLRARLA